jgi:hypothetical protein
MLHEMGYGIRKYMNTILQEYFYIPGAVNDILHEVLLVEIVQNWSKRRNSSDILWSQVRKLLLDDLQCLIILCSWC